MATTWTKKTKNATSFVNKTKQSLEQINMLKEDSFFLLLETGDKIVIRAGTDSWTNKPKT